MSMTPLDPAMWNERFGSDEYVYGKQPNDFLCEFSNAIPLGKVLCLAEGEGRNAVYLAGLGYSVTAVDFSAQAIAKTRRLAEQNGVSIDCVQADLTSWHLGEGCWQGIVGIFCHLPSEFRRTLHQRIVAGLASKGVVLFELYSPQQLKFATGGPKDGDWLLTPEELESDFAELSILKNQEVERTIHEGELHNGPSAVVQFLAQRSE